jgi:hypothetical protein
LLVVERSGVYGCVNLPTKLEILSDLMLGFVRVDVT